MNRQGTLSAVAVVVISSFCLGCSSQEPQQVEQKLEGTLSVSGLEKFAEAYRDSTILDKPFVLQLDDKAVVCVTVGSAGQGIRYQFYEYLDGKLVRIGVVDDQSSE